MGMGQSLLTHKHTSFLRFILCRAWNTNNSCGETCKPIILLGRNRILHPHLAASYPLLPCIIRLVTPKILAGTAIILAGICWLYPNFWLASAHDPLCNALRSWFWLRGFSPEDSARRRNLLGTGGQNGCHFFWSFVISDKAILKQTWDDYSSEISSDY